MASAAVACAMVAVGDADLVRVIGGAADQPLLGLEGRNALRVEPVDQALHLAPSLRGRCRRRGEAAVCGSPCDQSSEVIRARHGRRFVAGASTSSCASGRKTWMPGTSPAMTRTVNCARSAKTPRGDWQGTPPQATNTAASSPRQDGRHDRSHPVCLCLRDLSGRGRGHGAAGVADGRAAVGRGDQRSLLHAAVPAGLAAAPGRRARGLARPAGLYRHRAVLSGQPDAPDLCLQPRARAGHHLDARQSRAAVCGGARRGAAARAAAGPATGRPRARGGRRRHHHASPARATSAIGEALRCCCRSPAR